MEKILMLVLNPSFDEITEELDDMDGWMDGGRYLSITTQLLIFILLFFIIYNIYFININLSILNYQYFIIIKI